MKMLTNQFFLHKKSSSEHSSPPQSLNTWFLFTSVLLPHLDNPTGFSPSIQLDLINTSSWSSPPLVVLVMTLLQGTQGLVNQEPSGSHLGIQGTQGPGRQDLIGLRPDHNSFLVFFHSNVFLSISHHLTHLTHQLPKVSLHSSPGRAAIPKLLRQSY